MVLPEECLENRETYCVRGLLIWFLIILGAIFAFVLGVLFYKKRRAKKEAANRNGPDNKVVELDSPFSVSKSRRNSIAFARVSTNIFLELKKGNEIREMSRRSSAMHDILA
ncbi:Oidioi.mRNA.OKI2018_I69.XSR.g14491.t1.cds [Oikopleura dioica]|uniref:Oidioi.mRNA.OKI2018_I69.XSR.g14491.t1.cds n=1 Tax=Oikopleura dioica TaxID=34765 RepID=A0ABN7SA24_OIKDI|nr:Oidioi.mRNA.OKI2018_I69.XSR.g14491.t1.cds [Oikopleura dioica]